ncbi:TetR/AcrR family transcriptional regulator [Photobacterium ganghwense]|uniref:TetR family transcriptional regulator n=1 Tax=Photobacterium ganghwense TaxID=320778 RepID=A0A0J1HFG3_9GAMM|nr:TetR/AcrR family transcriptional regulator [Photobacterium ganghwense]KLV10339.1 TetR family transcriptional regulator [Photobacterium ganghwense]PSU09768.1 TetR/AcrR family transcriptional regulator [Photobacterium ganghwense]QSV17016.1 TetR/AcrR family transcriptional regulator [Photobacterium ganghwense]
MARKANFDRDEKLMEAMALFWQKGYANTAISDLVDALNINRFSLYNAFGDKQQLYYEALDAYLNKISFPSLSELTKETSSMPDLESFLKRFAAIQRQNTSGCFMQNALVEHAGEDQHVLTKGNALFDQLLLVITHAILNAQQSNEIKSSLPAEDLARLILNHMQGMRVLGKSKRYDDLDTALNCLLTLLRS